MMLSLICVITLNKAVVVEAAAKSNFNQRNLEHFRVQLVQQLPKYTHLNQYSCFMENDPKFLQVLKSLCSGSALIK